MTIIKSPDITFENQTDKRVFCTINPQLAQETGFITLVHQINGIKSAYFAGNKGSRILIFEMFDFYNNNTVKRLLCQALDTFLLGHTLNLGQRIYGITISGSNESHRTYTINQNVVFSSISLEWPLRLITNTENIDFYYRKKNSGWDKAEYDLKILATKIVMVENVDSVWIHDNEITISISVGDWEKINNIIKDFLCKLFEIKRQLINTHYTQVGNESLEN